MSSFWAFWPGLSGAYLCLTTRLRKLILLQGVLCLALCVAACEDSASSPRGPVVPSAAGATPGNTLTAIAAPPGSDERPLQPGSLGRGIDSDGLPALQPARGVNVGVDTLFQEDIKDPIERAKRVENAVLEMRRDLDATMPAIKRLVAIEKDIQLLTTQLQTLLNGEQAPEVPEPSVPYNSARSENEPVALAPRPVQAVDAIQQDESPALIAPTSPVIAPERVAQPPPIASPPATAPPAMATSPPVQTASSGLQANSLRLGEHADKTRIVIDLTGPVAYRHDLDNGEKILVVELNKAAWSGPAAQAVDSPLVQSWSAQPLEGGGTRLIIALRRDTAIIKDGLLNPDGSSGYRLMIDLRK